jgi:hypothetical protein
MASQTAPDKNGMIHAFVANLQAIVQKTET